MLNLHRVVFWIDPLFYFLPVDWPRPRVRLFLLHHETVFTQNSSLLTMVNWCVEKLPNVLFQQLTEKNLLPKVFEQ